MLHQLLSEHSLCNNPHWRQLAQKQARCDLICISDLHCLSFSVLTWNLPFFFFFFFYTCAYKDYFVTSQLQYGPINILTSSSCCHAKNKTKHIGHKLWSRLFLFVCVWRISVSLCFVFRWISSCHKYKTLCNQFQQTSLSNVKKCSGFERLCLYPGCPCGEATGVEMPSWNTSTAVRWLLIRLI